MRKSTKKTVRDPRKKTTVYGMTRAEKDRSKKWGSDNLGREQRKHLDSRIDAVYRARNYYHDDGPESAELKRARKLIADHDKRANAAEQKKRQAVRKACDRAKAAVLFSDSAKQALTAVVRLEEEAAQKGWTK